MNFTPEEYAAIELVAKKQAITPQHFDDLHQQLSMWACENYEYIEKLREGNNLGKFYKALTYQAYAENMKITIEENPYLDSYDRDSLRLEIGKQLLAGSDNYANELIEDSARPVALREYFTTEKSMRAVSRDNNVPLKSLSRYVQRTCQKYLLAL
jgi:hypothetical protein